MTRDTDTDDDRLSLVSKIHIARALDALRSTTAGWNCYAFVPRENAPRAMCHAEPIAGLLRDEESGGWYGVCAAHLDTALATGCPAVDLREEREETE